MERRATRWVAAGLGAVVLIAVAWMVISALASDESGHVDGDVLILGDSVTHMSADPITDRVGGEELEIRATPGHRSTDLLPILQSEVDERSGPDGGSLEKVALLVGYNDILDEALDRNVIPEMVELTSRFDCAVWLALPGEFGERSDELLQEHADRFPSVHVDHGWAEVVEADETLISDDGVHPTDAGKRALAVVYRDALHRWCGSALPI